jgi:Ca2+-binding EF-hand superfamily protein
MKEKINKEFNRLDFDKNDVITYDELERFLIEKVSACIADL